MLFIADIISLIHILIGIYIYIGFILLPGNHLPLYILIIIGIHIHWKLNNGMCILTVWENSIRETEATKAGYENIQYINRLLSYINISLDDDTAASIVIYSQRILCFFAIIRYSIYINKEYTNDIKLIASM
jgi:hypothetical protein